MSILKFDRKNYRKHGTKNKQLISRSLQDCGAGRSIVVDKSGEIIAGNGIYEQAQKLNIPVKVIETDGTELIAVKRTDLAPDDAKRQQLAILDNSTSDTSEFDLQMLAQDFTPSEMLDFGIELEQTELEDPDRVEEDTPPEEDSIPQRCQPGDIWQLGDHRLMCGDSTDAEQVRRLMDGSMADMLLTDPPYNVDYTGSNGKKIQNDKMADTTFTEFLTAAFAAADSVFKEGGAFYIWYADLKSLNFLTALKNTGWELKQKLVWNKNTFTLGRSDYQWKHELCLYGWKDGAKHYFIDDRTQTTVVEDSLPDFNTLTKAELVKILQDLHSDKVPTTVINCEKPLRSDEHPTMKPVKLMGLLIRNSSRQGETVLDIFGGSGSTLMACEQLNRKCYTMELDPHYCDVILQRWENFTGLKAVKINA